MYHQFVEDGGIVTQKLEQAQADRLAGAEEQAVNCRHILGVGNFGQTVVHQFLEGDGSQNQGRKIGDIQTNGNIGAVIGADLGAAAVKMYHKSAIIFG